MAVSNNIQHNRGYFKEIYVVLEPPPPSPLVRMLWGTSLKEPLAVKRAFNCYLPAGDHSISDILAGKSSEEEKKKLLFFFVGG